MAKNPKEYDEPAKVEKTSEEPPVNTAQEPYPTGHPYHPPTKKVPMNEAPPEEQPEEPAPPAPPTRSSRKE